MALFVCVWGRRKADQLKPQGRVQNMIEAVTIYIRDEVVRPSIHHGDGWTAHFTALFLAVLAFNLFGLIPGGGAASAHIAVTGAFAFMTLAAMLIFGMKAQGVGTFWVTLVPVPFTLAPMGLAIWLILAVIEVAGLIIKPVALAIRLFANMFAGHVVILSFTSLVLHCFIRRPNPGASCLCPRWIWHAGRHRHLPPEDFGVLYPSLRFHSLECPFRGRLSSSRSLIA